MHFTAKFIVNPPPQAAGTVHFAMVVDDVLAASSRPDRPSSVSGPQERVLGHTVEQMADSAPVVPILEAPVPQLGCSEVGSPVLEHAAEHRCDLALLVAGAGLVRRGGVKRGTPLANRQPRAVYKYKAP